LETLIRRGLVHDLRQRPAADALLKSLACLASWPGERPTTTLFRERALDRAGAKLQKAGLRVPIVQCMLGDVHLAWNYAWRIGLTDVPPPDAPLSPANRSRKDAQAIPTPAELRERAAQVRAGWTVGRRMKQLAAAQPGQDEGD
jgi:hypothetical protein